MSFSGRVDDDDDPNYYGLMYQSRCIASMQGESDVVSTFLVGTLNLTAINEIHCVEYNDEIPKITASRYSHPYEVWDIAPSPHLSNGDLFFTVYNTGDECGASLWRINQEGSNGSISSSSRYLHGNNDNDDNDENGRKDENTGNNGELDELMVLPPVSHNMQCVLWDPASASRIITVEEKQLRLWRTDHSNIHNNNNNSNNNSNNNNNNNNNSSTSSSLSATAAEQITTGNKRLVCGAWDPHHPEIVAAGGEGDIHLIDLRANTHRRGHQHHHQPHQSRGGYHGTTVTAAHDICVRSVDFNPNRQHMLVSGGDDGTVRVWDLRRPDEAVAVLVGHSHWVSSVAYNPFHDSLLCSASTDSLVNLWSVPSVSSTPLGALRDHPDDTNTTATAANEDNGNEDNGNENNGNENNGNENNNNENNNNENESNSEVEDRMVVSLDEHDDSVYSAAWSASNAWIFASMSFGGRLMIHHVPEEEKYRILEY